MFLYDKWKVWLRWISNNQKRWTNIRLHESQWNPWRIGCRIKCNSWAVWHKIQQLSLSVANILEFYFQFSLRFLNAIKVWTQIQNKKNVWQISPWTFYNSSTSWIKKVFNLDAFYFPFNVFLHLFEFPSILKLQNNYTDRKIMNALTKRTEANVKKLTEAVAQMCSVKKVFIEISQNSLENTIARVLSYRVAVQLMRYLNKISLFIMTCSQTARKYYRALL